MQQAMFKCVCFKAEGPCNNHQLMWTMKAAPCFLECRFQCIHLQLLTVYTHVCAYYFSHAQVDSRIYSLRSLHSKTQAYCRIEKKSVG